MTTKQKTCKSCRQRFAPSRPMQSACSTACAIAIAERKREKQAQQEEARKRKEATKQRAEARQKLKTRADYVREAQSAFNAYIRARDADRPCVSCGRHHDGQFHAGHYLSTGARPELRFEELNVWKQCAPCNNHLSGNVVLYRRALVELIGPEKVEWLEGPHEPKKYTIDDLKTIKAEYIRKRKEIEA